MLLRSLVAMGGAVYCAGNASPLAEANFMHDAHAARVVVHASRRRARSCSRRRRDQPDDHSTRVHRAG